MDQNEIVRRLDEVRARIREHLADAPTPRLGAALPADDPLELGEALRNYRLPSEPNLNTTPHLEAANTGAVITAPVTLDSKIPVVGPLLTLLRRLARPFVQPILDPYLDRQERFNVDVVRYLNEFGQRLEKRLENLGAELGHWIADPGFIEARLDAALTDYDEALKARHTVLFDALEEEIWALRSLVRDLQVGSGEQLHEFEVRFVERAQAVDARFDEKDQALSDAVRAMSERTPASSLSEVELLSTQTMLRRVLDRLEPGPRPGGEQVQPSASAGLGDWLEDQHYRAFQERFRGDEQVIAERMKAYVAEFDRAAGPVADLGCGRGEFLELLHSSGFDCIGVEVNAAEVEEGQRRGLPIEPGDLFEWLEDREAASLGGVVLTEVIEHLPPRSWWRLVELAATRLAPGGTLLIETINPESLYALARAFVIDPTHTRPTHPQLLAFMARRAGFASVEVRFQAEVPASDRVAKIESNALTDDPASLRLIETINTRIEQVNRLCCAPQEYILLARHSPAKP